MMVLVNSCIVRMNVGFGVESVEKNCANRHASHAGFSCSSCARNRRPNVKFFICKCAQISQVASSNSLGHEIPDLFGPSDLNMFNHGSHLVFWVQALLFFEYNHIITRSIFVVEASHSIDQFPH